MSAFEDKRESILKQSLDLFARRGYYGTGLAQILATCRIPKGSFYHYFPGGKEELGVRIINYAYETMERTILSDIFSLSDEADQVFAAMARYLAERVLNTDHLLSSLLITLMGIEGSDTSPAMFSTSQEVYRRWQGLYFEKLLKCGYGAELAQPLSSTLFSLINGSLISSWIKQDPSDLLAISQALPHWLPRLKDAHRGI